MLNFSKPSSPRSRATLPVESFHTHKNVSYGTPFSRMSERISVDPKTNSSYNKKTGTNLTLINMLRKVPSQAKKKERWYYRIFRCLRFGNLSRWEKSLRRLNSRSMRDNSPRGRFLNKIAKVQNFGMAIHSSSDLKKKKNFLVVVYLVKKFIQIIKTYTYVKRIFHLRSYHFGVIGDMSNFYQRGHEFGEKFFGNLTNRPSENYVKQIFTLYISLMN